ncbi:hypothetical protein SY111_16710 [Ligilactobacillus agilis]|uniref:Uncharacterized protein n=1 Tax=Ligilactobacillus agilis TaxID=1601 RepID=A0A6F9XV17_9LACO|nr:hypothetical protein [Ligilactobacillus agilis]GET09047.1 hypothetical protein SY111_16710 [Ligilactobacillus agilis]
MENEGKGVYVFEPQKRSESEIQARRAWLKNLLAELQAEQKKRGVKNW